VLAASINKVIIALMMEAASTSEIQITRHSMPEELEELFAHSFSPEKKTKERKKNHQSVFDWKAY
jgi:hypothetical protein